MFGCSFISSGHAIAFRSADFAGGINSLVYSSEQVSNEVYCPAPPSGGAFEVNVSITVLVSGVRHNHIHMNARTQGFPEEHLIVHINSPAIFYCCISSNVAALKLELRLYSLFP